MIARFDRIVVVAGAQAAGKSTFIRRWQRNRIPASIANALPNGSADWPVVLAKNVGDAAAFASGDSRVILHYDLTRPLDGVDFEADPALGLLGYANKATVVLITPNATELAKRMAVRHLRMSAGKKFRRPAPLVSPGGWAMTQLSRMPHSLRRFALSSGVLSKKWLDFRSSFGQWHWQVFKYYLRRQPLAEMEADFLSCVSHVMPTDSCLIRLKPTLRWRSKGIGWRFDRQTNRPLVEAGATDSRKRIQAPATRIVAAHPCRSDGAPRTS